MAGARDGEPGRLAMGRIDQYLIGPEGPGDEEFHHYITEYLSDWWARRGGGFEAVRVIDTADPPRAADLRDLFFRNRSRPASTMPGHRPARPCSTTSVWSVPSCR
jgi:hypothetical protein